MPLGELPQPVLGDPAEVHVRVRRGDPEVAQPPGTAGILHVPAGAIAEVLGLAAGLDRQGPGLGSGGAGQRRERPPFLLSPVKYGRDPAAREGTDELGNMPGRGAQPGLVAAALDGVLGLEPQLAAQPPEVQPLAAGQVIVACCGELPGAGLAGAPPPGTVRQAERGFPLGQQIAVRHQAGGSRAARGSRGKRVQPGRQGRPGG